jgi:hypothetical protein
MEPSQIAHSLLAAHADRVTELARLYGVLERAAMAHAPASAHRALSARIVEWEVADARAEREDVVSLAAEERERMSDAVDRAIADAERHAEGLSAQADEHAVVSALRRIRGAFPRDLTRAALARFRRSAARRERIAALGGPAFLLGSGTVFAGRSRADCERV